MNKVKIISLIAIFSIIVILVIIFILLRLNNPDTYHKNALSIKETATTHGLNISINKVTTKDNICIEKDGFNCTNNFKSVYGRFIVINFTIENLYTYTDIALFINNNSDTYTMENTLKSLKIENIKINNLPKIGTPNLYYKDLNKFANSEFLDENKINSMLDFTIISDDTADFSTPVLYNNCANPIVLSLVNQNIKTDYTITDTSIPITYDGTLLTRCNVNIQDIACSLSFDIYIVNNNNEKFKTTVYLEIPYSDSESSILDGSITVFKDTNFIFYKYE